MDNQKILEAIAALETKMQSMSKEDERIPEMQKQIAALQDEFRRAVQAGAEKKEAEVEMTFGQEFVKSASYSDFIAGRTRAARFEKDAPTPTKTPTVTTHKDTMKIPSDNLTVESFIPAVPTSGNLVEYVKESSWANNAAAVLEAGTKPLSGIQFQTVQVPVQVIAHILRVTKQLVSDAPALAAYVDARMGRGVNKVAEEELVGGSGVAPHLSGLMKSGNYTPHGLTKGTGETDLDLIRKSAMAVRVAGYTPNVVMLNPIDYDRLLGLKLTNGAYLISNPVANETPRLWGLNVCISSSVQSGKFLVGDFSVAQIWNRQGTTIEMFEQDNDNVQKNLVTIRAERRMALTMESALAFVGGALWDAAGSGSGSGS